MIVWGGDGLHSGGARWNAAADSWAPISGLNTYCPVRNGHTAVWTGSQMIVWGGRTDTGTPLGDGYIYDPVADSWTPMSFEGAPSPRHSHTAVWTGNRMLVWGGLDEFNGSYDKANGVAYDPLSDSWSPISAADAPHERGGHVAVWTQGPR